MSDALVMLERALGYFAAADMASAPVAVQADALRGLECGGSRLSAAGARVLSAFVARGGQKEDGHGSARAWLAWQTRTTRAAAAGHVGWARRLAAHPAVAGGLAAGSLPVSWAWQVCGWSERLPEDARAGADKILVQAAAGGRAWRIWRAWPRRSAGAPPAPAMTATTGSASGGCTRP